MPPRQPAHDPSYLDEHHQRISEFANDYFDDDEERAVFVDTLLERRGYVRTASWAPPLPPDPNGGSGQGAGGAPAGAPKPHPYFKR